MNDDAPPPGLSGKPLLMARATALTVSIGVLVLLMVRASGGCRSADTSAVAEPHSAAPSASAPASAPAAAATTSEPAYFPGSKAWGGDGLRVASAAPAASAPTAPAASASAKVPVKPRYFPGSKSLGGSVVEPDENQN